jgi:hypothetical protein
MSMGAIITDLNIYRTANVLVKQHGEDAPTEAAMRADAMLDKGDLDSYTEWRRILRSEFGWMCLPSGIS